MKTAALTEGQVETCDLIVVGAGPAGLSFVRALEGCGLNIKIVEQLPRSILADPKKWRSLPVQVADWLRIQRRQSVLPRVGQLLVEKMTPLSLESTLKYDLPLWIIARLGTHTAPPPDPKQ